MGNRPTSYIEQILTSPCEIFLQSRNAFLRMCESNLTCVECYFSFLRHALSIGFPPEGVIVFHDVGAGANSGRVRDQNSNAIQYAIHRVLVAQEKSIVA